MRKGIFAIFAFALFLSHCYGQASPKAPVSVFVTKAFITPDGILHCQWTIRNNGKEPVEVFSSFLEGMTEGMVEIGAGTVLVQSTWPSELPGYPIYSFPKERFVNLAPNELISGELARHIAPAGHGSAVTEVRLLIGYGHNRERIEADIQRSRKEGVEFQGNAIIRWQTTAYSSGTGIRS
jgi:hypothetical protein